jgi:DNA-binding transcriptional MerR regulator
VSDDAPEVLTIHQLEAASGVPARRIRHFVSEGLLAPPVGKGRAAHYTRQHLERLRQIQALRDVNLGLEEIKRRLGDPVETAPVEGGPSAAMWRRWEIAPGLELHARADLDRDVAEMARVLVNVARQLMTAERGFEP